tara:strand:+ start:89 stop:337 length:249 start_codon:yes stop_codon:yes gene_type:complete
MLESLPVQTPAYPDGLTQREAELLQLFCGDKTDWEMGEELFISVSTVGNHVSNILNKTGAVSRTEAASHDNQHDLVTADPAQ